MELRQLRYFLAVARTLNFTRAAEEMHIAQPPLSRQISNLEDELGVRLIEREARPMRLTSSGVFFQERAQEIVLRVDRLKNEAVAHGRSGRQTMRIGFEASTIYGHLPAVIRHLRQENPHLDIDLREMSGATQVEAIRNGTVDVGVGRAVLTDSDVEQTVIRQEPFHVALPQESRLSGLASVRLAQLAGENLILYNEQSGTDRLNLVARLIDQAQIPFAKRVQTRDLLAALGLVAAGAGICIVPATVSRMRATDVSYARLDEPDASSPIVLSVHRANRSMAIRQVRRELDRILAAADDGDVAAPSK